GDALKERLPAGEAVGLLRALDAEHAKHIVSDAQRHRDGLKRVGIHAVEPLVGHASPEHDLFSARRDPAGDPLVETLAATQTDLAREAHGCPQPELVPPDAHYRRGPRPPSALR